MHASLFILLHVLCHSKCNRKSNDKPIRVILSIVLSTDKNNNNNNSDKNDFNTHVIWLYIYFCFSPGNSHYVVQKTFHKSTAKFRQFMFISLFQCCVPFVLRFDLFVVCLYTKETKKFEMNEHINGPIRMFTIWVRKVRQDWSIYTHTYISFFHLINYMSTQKILYLATDTLRSAILFARTLRSNARQKSN